MWLCVLSDPQGLNSPLWQQQASRPLSASARLCGSEVPPARADATFKVTMVPGDGVGPELMTAVKEVFKVLFTMMETESPVSFWHNKIHDELKSWQYTEKRFEYRDLNSSLTFMFDILFFSTFNLCVYGWYTAICIKIPISFVHTGRRRPCGIRGVSSERGTEHGQRGEAGASVNLDEEQQSGHEG